MAESRTQRRRRGEAPPASRRSTCHQHPDCNTPLPIRPNPLIKQRRFILPIRLINSALIATAVYALRGIYYTLLSEGKVPFALTGMAVGMVSVIGYTPDVLAPLVSGLVLDAWPGAEGFQILFLLIGVICILGLFASVAIYRKLRAGYE